MYIYKINIIFNHEENPQIEQKIEDMLRSVLDKYDGELVSVGIDILDGENYGRCQKCGCWTSDITKDGFITGLSNGAQINGEWLCDLCLPKDHPNAF